MSLALLQRRVLEKTYKVAYEYATMDFTPARLGIVNIMPVEDPRTLVYRRRKNAGGLLAPRNPGEDIETITGGLDRIDEEVGLYNFAKSKITPATEIYGLRSPNSLDPESMYALGEVLAEHTEYITGILNNTLRLFASRAFVPTITIDGVSYTNDHIEQLDYSANAWNNTSTDILGQLLDLKQNYFGTNKETSEITIMMRTSVFNDIIKNEGFIKVLGFNIGAGVIPTALPQARIQEALRPYGINLVLWNDAYYASNNANPYDTSYFLDTAHVVVLPRGYWGGEIANNSANQLITPRSNVAPFVDLILAPDPDFKDKTIKSGGISSPSFGNIPGAYYFTGWYDMSEPNKANKYVSSVATSMGLFVERNAGIKYIKVKS